ncbi:MAG: hypothetical protein Q7T66_10180 [Herminiimonas sp.]|jgi:hypothetical protein|uniref:hypothetical protein n=1 Tax=Herminiimonas sp. TaxID=1926289 RepID=UPI00272688B5|nr:hypothetical protein [Herminiimonas sp.]MDO9421019.1 hypothetical protein [Herminiimonas sp.]
MDDNDHEYFGIDEGNEALREYASNLTDSEKDELLARIKEDEAFAELMRNAIDEVNNLFTVAAVGDDGDYEETLEEMIHDIDNPEPSVHRLRMYYLENRDEIDMSALLSTSDEEEQYSNRLDALLETYSAKHA